MNIRLFPLKGGVEYVVCSAILVKDDTRMHYPPVGVKEGYVACGLRHHNCYEVIAKIYGFGVGQEGYPPKYHSYEKVEGFLTSHNRFVTREEAAELVIRIGQVDKLEFKNRCHSEDLY